MKRICTFLALAGALSWITTASAQDDTKKPERPRPPQGQPDIGQLLERLDRNKDGMLDKEEAPERLKESFDQFDVNKDGKLSKDELLKAFQRFGARPPGTPPSPGPNPGGGQEPLLRIVDRNGDGKISPEEWQNAGKYLAKFDKNQDGAIDREEVAAALREMGGAAARPPGDAPRPGPDAGRGVEAMLQRFDENKDGKISKEEAKGPLAEGFDRLDENKDGSLDKNELQKAAARFRPPGGDTPRPGGQPGADRPGRPAASFDDLDKNVDGRLTKDELKGNPLAEKFDDADTNKDGKIDPKEFEKFMQKAEKK